MCLHVTKHTTSTLPSPPPLGPPPRCTAKFACYTVVCAELTCQRAQLSDGQLVLELGCGWGALSIYIASKYPTSHVTAVCASQAQKLFVGKRRRQRGLTNLQVLELNCEGTIVTSLKKAQANRVDSSQLVGSILKQPWSRLCCGCIKAECSKSLYD